MLLNLPWSCYKNTWFEKLAPWVFRGVFFIVFQQSSTLTCGHIFLIFKVFTGSDGGGWESKRSVQRVPSRHSWRRCRRRCTLPLSFHDRVRSYRGISRSHHVQTYRKVSQNYRLKEITQSIFHICILSQCKESWSLWIYMTMSIISSTLMCWPRPSFIFVQLILWR